MSGDDHGAGGGTDPRSLPLATSRVWDSPSADPNDETFGDVVGPIDADAGFGAHEVVLVGEPFDEGVLGRKGAAAGPDAIRESLMGVKTHHFARGPVSAGGTTAPTVADAGDVDTGAVTPTLGDVREAAGSVAAAVHASSATPVFVGGDNSLTVPNVRPLLDAVPADETVGVVNFDAHLDVREVREAPTSGTPYRELLEAGLDAYVVVGARDFETSSAYVEYLADRDGVVVTAETVGAAPATVLEEVQVATADVDHLYVSVDCDVLDAAAAPGVSAPTPGGLATRDLFRLVGDLATDPRLRGAEVVECAPPLDVGRRTADAAARTVAHLCSAITGERATHEGRARAGTGGDPA